ncbi:MAG: hypothetical protein RBT75_19355 [Anaerolineae bacterium]|jgi:hypothetical protein|nr:hypothetical protein [Anaerolineae bacterium]
MSEPEPTMQYHTTGDGETITRAVENLLCVFTPEQLLFISSLAVERDRQGFGEVRLAWYRGKLAKIASESTWLPDGLPKNSPETT